MIYSIDAGFAGQMNPSKRAQELLDQPKETQSLGMLLDDFFLYYALEFPYTTSYISVTEGKVLPKTSTDWIKLKDADRLVIQCVVNPGMFAFFLLQNERPTHLLN
jgi:non-canonical poly(A) RNA polymerase PAPD5/7